MNIKSCARGHFYDADIDASCPYCNTEHTFISFENRMQDGTTVGGNTGETVGPGMQNANTVRGDQTVGPIRDGGQSRGRSGQMEEDQVTRPPFGWKPSKKDTDNETVSDYGKKIGFDPVVGWLICLSGKNKGRAYELKGRINKIGRSSKMDVCIDGDPTITSDSHANLSYDPRYNNFYLYPGNNRNNIYLNQKPVFSSEFLKIYDLIELGETQVMFIPLCSEHFRWDIQEGRK